MPSNDRRRSSTGPDRRTFVGLAAGGLAATALAGGDLSAEERGQVPEPKTFRDHLLDCLGGPWPEPCPLDVRRRDPVEFRGLRIESSRQEGYRIESIDYEVEPGERVPALVLVPDGVDAEHPAPAVAVWHQHNGEWHLGKSEPAGLAGNPMHHTGAALAKEGYVVLCPDALCFEERQSPVLEKGNFERFEFLRLTVAGRCMAWKNILDMRRAIDVLVSRPEVDAARIGCYGHSMGSTHTWLVGPWDERIRCLVGNCCLPTYAAIHRTHLLHCFPNFIPGLFQYGDTPDIAALIAPRPLLLTLGEADKGSPLEAGRAGVTRIGDAYRAAGAADRFSAFIEPGVGHVLSDAMWQKTRDWFARHLEPQAS
ncbi:MAG: dienelactone hydrolase family protein [Planctomycetia bacterium]